MRSLTELKHLKRWIKASFIQILRPLVEQGFTLYVEGQDRQTNKTPNFIELRIDGPYTDPIGSFGEYRSYIEVNLLGTSTRDDNIFHRDNLQGLMQYMLNRDVWIKRTGNEGKNPVDDGSCFELMKLLASDRLKTSDFGQIDPNTEVYQAVCEAHYEMHFNLEIAVHASN